jgi:hypothetical protein
MPALVVVGMLSRSALLDPLVDLPRTFLSATTLLALASPERSRRWLGLEPGLAIGFGAMALACDWALEMSFPGRGWTDVWALIMGALLLALASRRVAERAKLALCGGFAIAAVVHCAVSLHAGENPISKREAADGKMAANSAVARVGGKPHPMLRGLRIPEWRARILEWLAERVPRGSTCFIYANLPALYSLLDCRNPTHLDTTIADFPSAGDAEEAAAALRRSPPDFILAYDNMWMSPGIAVDLGGKAEHYDSWNPRASMAIHLGLRAIIDRYEDLGLVSEALPADGEQASGFWDVLGAVRVYRRR